MHETKKGIVFNIHGLFLESFAGLFVLSFQLECVVGAERFFQTVEVLRNAKNLKGIGPTFNGLSGGAYLGDRRDSGELEV